VGEFGICHFIGMVTVVHGVLWIVCCVGVSV